MYSEVVQPIQILRKIQHFDCKTSHFDVHVERSRFNLLFIVFFIHIKNLNI